MRASQPSSTARLIAAATVLSFGDGREAEIVSAESAAWCARLLSTSMSDRLLLSSVRSPIGRAVWRLAERLTLPGIVRHYALRKSFLEKVWRAARAEGCTQLLVLGAGLDTLGVRVAGADAEARVVEVDHPATQAIKRRVTGGLSGHPLRLVEGRLDRPGWAQALMASGELMPDRPTLAVLEGVSMYFREAEVAALLSELATLSVPRLRLALTLFDRPAAGPVGFHPTSRLVAAWLRLVGEPFRWGCGTDTLGPFLLSSGFRLARHVGPPELHVLAGPPRGPILHGEGVAIADRVA